VTGDCHAGIRGSRELRRSRPPDELVCFVSERQKILLRVHRARRSIFRWHTVDQHVLPAKQHIYFCFYAVDCSVDVDRVSTLQRQLSALHAPGHRSPDEDLGCARHDWRSAHSAGGR